MNNFLIVGTQRTGSSALGEAIGLHPNITCGWEWTQRSPWLNKIKVAEQALMGDFSVLGDHDQEHMVRVFNNNKAWLGFRRLFRSSNMWLVHPRLAPALWSDRLEGYLRWVKRHPNIHIIHIVRKDNMEWLKSKFISKESKTYWGQSYPQEIKVTIPIKEAITRLRAKNWVDSRLSILRNSNPYLQVIYEDLLADNKKVVTSTLSFLNCDAGVLPPITERKLKPQSKGAASSYISNYDSLDYHLKKNNLLIAEF